MPGSILVLDRDAALHAALCKAAPQYQDEMIACHQTADALRLLGGDQVRVVIAGPAILAGGGVRFLQAAHEGRPDVVTVLAVPKDGSGLSERDLVRIGASDVIVFPAAPRSLKSAIEHAVELSRSMTGARAANAETESIGRAITVTSPSGGCGKTFFATNLAYAIASTTGKRVALVDLDLQFGEVVTALRLRPQYTITDLLEGRADAGDSLRAELREFMVRHPSGIDVLAACKDPQEADRVSSPDITEIIQVAKTLYHYVIVDTPAALTEPVLAAFDQSESLAVLATLDVPSVRNLGVFLQTLDRLRIPQAGVSLVLNKAERDVGLSTAEVQRLFPQGFKGILPYSKEVSRALNAGRLVVEASPGCDVARGLTTTFAALVPGESSLEAGTQSTVVPDGGMSLFARLFRRVAPRHS